ncbi:S1 RNA-binding domain-containing protein [Clostridium tyrobutyricum]|uniref:Transcription accessory protein (S1 RNA-binding domain) n=1 Tax=Clostridium tyrobutyricum DIVETGP TaxID=1408889 RepID=W6N430_CLOTY|nr:Tex family protein [Clostridium tyrobutyricum]AND83446.1 protein tex [Clostridium tyrobutyricum]ANP68244.1 RNA-binding transcriptional accessory protein [Clostridium tyrobutyricum]MBV4433243.1 RNA-binding transcriptional accessory protein [Clostridium tyrobutyricum]QNB67409.1 S1 RNA-binding domain-containing protein [Clostridium tyrobutyricum]CDL91258.1 Transcription accessory protein (S1 RNA-binding domain) [Clostridium tyrobutyricum DIVETGP]
MNNIVDMLAEELDVNKKYLNNVIELLDSGNTVPFIARYRKELTGSMSDVTLRKLEERLTYLRNLKSRKEDVIRIISEQGKLTDELQKSIEKSNTLTEVEDIYRPYKPKKRTRAIIAQEKGLKSLSQVIWDGNFNEDIEKYASEFINEEKGVDSVKDALAGAMDIISEIISDEAKYRKWIRKFVNDNGLIETKGESKEPTPYEMYYDYREAIKSIPAHRVLAINRGEKEKVLSVKVTCDMDRILEYLKAQCIKENSITDAYIEKSVEDSLKRLIYPSIEREIRSELTDMGEEGAIKIFKANLKALLMQPPIKGKNVLGYDPGFRNGCKIAVLDDTGKLLDTAIIYPTAPQNDVDGSIKKLKDLVYKNDVDVVSLGNGTASRESEEVISRLIKEVKEEKGKDLYYVIVSEAGASVYSASEVAAKDYPDINVSIRGAISIGRRLQDPLAELVKIDPKSIGVGQYQHDVTPKKLDDSLSGIVEDCVNSVGVDLNIATPSLLSYISGINSAIASNIVDYRDKNGKFKNRKELLKVKRLGAKAFEQCAGFLRVMESSEPLDNTSVHPESYKAAKGLLDTIGYISDDLRNSSISDIDNRIEKIGMGNLSDKLGVGIPTLKDIIKEIKKPGRDPREELPKPILKTGIVDMNQLKPGMVLTGTVRNVADFGAFVDIGVHQDGLVHISQLSDKFVKHPLDVVKVGDIVHVTVIEVDEKRKRIALSMKKQ